MPKEKEVKEKKCKNGAHNFGPTGNPWFDKCYFCPAIRKKESIKIKSVK